MNYYVGAFSIGFYYLMNGCNTFNEVLRQLCILNKLFNTYVAILSVCDLSSGAIGLVHINNELYSQLIAKGLTFVTTETRVKYRKSSYYDGIRFFRDGQI